jgi:hypothetical protein
MTVTIHRDDPMIMTIAAGHVGTRACDIGVA